MCICTYMHKGTHEVELQDQRQEPPHGQMHAQPTKPRTVEPRMPGQSRLKVWKLLESFIAAEVGGPPHPDMSGCCKAEEPGVPQHSWWQQQKTPLKQNGAFWTQADFLLLSLSFQPDYGLARGYHPRFAGLPANHLWKHPGVC